MYPSCEKGAVSMFRRIVVATDGSEGARKAVRYVAEK
ncbi:MAG: universal stress protein [Brockia lithotrophica]|nr:universal stress protein [Brockia lithotrophica]